MSKKREHPRRTNEIRLATGVLEGLMGSADDELEEFRDWRVATKNVDVLQLVRARELLDRIAAVIQRGDAVQWKALDGAWRVLVGGVDAKRVQSDVHGPGGETAPPDAVGAIPAAPSSATRSAEPGSRSGVGPSVAEASTRPAEFVPPPSLSAAPVRSVDGASPAPAQLAAGVPIPGPIVTVGGPPRQVSPWAGGQVARDTPGLGASSPAAPTSAVPVVGATAAEPAPPHPPAGLAGSDVDSTQGVDLRHIWSEPLPFKGESAAPEPGAALADLPPVASRDVDATGFMAAPVLVDETLPFTGSVSLRKELAKASASASRPPAKPVDPPAMPSAASDTAVVELSVEQFASLCANCEVYPERVAAVQQQFGVPDAEARRALDAHWAARFRADAAAYRAFGARFHGYRQWLMAERGRTMK